MLEHSDPSISLPTRNDANRLWRAKFESLTFPRSMGAKGADVIGACETCDRVRKVVKLPGRKDSNCGECSDDIALLISLHALIKSAESQAKNADELEIEAGLILERLLTRYKTGIRVPSFFSREKLA